MIKELILSANLLFAPLLNTVVSEAKSVHNNNKVILGITISQAILESKLLYKPSSLAVKHKNLFGIKGKGTLGYVKVKTWEVINGKRIIVYAKFAKNKTLADSFKQHYRLLQRPRYREVLESKTIEEAAQALYKAGYATDPKYPKKLIRIYYKHVAHRI